MSLAVVARKGTPILYIRGTVRGKTIFESAGTADPKKAEDYRVKREGEIWDRRLHGKRAVGTFQDIVDSYLDFEERSPATMVYLKKLVQHFRNVSPDEIDQGAADEACRKLLTKSAKAATKIRAVYTPLSAVLKHGAIRKMCAPPMFQKPTVKQTRMVFLLPEQVNALIEAAAPHLRPLFTFLVGTGARMSEALELQWSDVDLHGARAIVRQKQGDFRYIDLYPRVVAALAALPQPAAGEKRSGTVFKTPDRVKKDGTVKKQGGAYGRTRESGGQIGTGWASACRRAGLPGRWRTWQTAENKEMKAFVPEATPHSLRHTFATHHYCVHKDLLKLMGDGGWGTITMVSRYAKKMPDAYRDEILAWWAGAPAEIARKKA